MPAWDFSQFSLVGVTYSSPVISRSVQSALFLNSSYSKFAFGTLVIYTVQDQGQNMNDII